MINPIFRGTIREGKINLDNPARFAAHLKNYEGKRVEVVLRKEKSQRSLNQNSYYHGVVVKTLSDFTGYDPEEMHEVLKFKFLRIRKRIKKKILTSAGSTTKLSTAEFEEYLEKIRRWAAQDLGCYIPLPREIDYGQQENKQSFC